MKKINLLIVQTLLFFSLVGCSESTVRTDMFDNFKIVTETTKARSYFAPFSRGDGYNYDYKIYHKDQLLFENEKGKAAIEFRFLQRKPYVIKVIDGDDIHHIVYENDGKLGHIKLLYSLHKITHGLYSSGDENGSNYILIEGSNVMVIKQPEGFGRQGSFDWFSPNRHILAIIISDKEGTLISIQLLNLITGKQSEVEIKPVKRIDFFSLEKIHDVHNTYALEYCWLENHFEWVKQGGDYVTLKQKLPPEPFEFSTNSECYKRYRGE